MHSLHLHPLQEIVCLTSMLAQSIGRQYSLTDWVRQSWGSIHLNNPAITGRQTH
jgi:hypothetical protein